MPSKHADAESVPALTQNVVKVALAVTCLGDLLKTRKKTSAARDSLMRLKSTLERKKKEIWRALGFYSSSSALGSFLMT